MALDALSSIHRPGGGDGIEDVFERLATQPDATPAEQTLAACCKALEGRSMTASALRSAQSVMLNAIVSGIEGPIGPVLARIAVDVMAPMGDAGDARAVGHSALGTIAARSSSESEALLAKTANEAASRRVPHPSALAARIEALKMVADGVGGGPEQVLAAYGSRMSNAVEDAGNARDMGYDVLDAIAKGSRDAALGSLAQTAWDATGQVLTHATGLKAQREAFGMIVAGTGGKSDTQLMADFGRRTAELISSDVEGAILGRSVLESIATRSLKKEEQLVAAAGHRLSSTRASDYDSITAQNVTFESLKAGVSRTPERALAELGLSALEATRDVRNARSMGEVVIASIVDSATDDAVRKAASGASRRGSSPGIVNRLLGRDPDEGSVERQREGLQAIVDAIAAREAEQQAVRDERNMEEIKKMADALSPEPKPADVKVEDKEVVIGGIRIARRPAREDDAAARGDR